MLANERQISNISELFGKLKIKITFQFSHTDKCPGELNFWRILAFNHMILETRQKYTIKPKWYVVYVMF